MLGVNQYDLVCSEAQSKVIEETLRRYNNACEFIVSVAQKNKVRGHVALAKTKIFDPVAMQQVGLQKYVQDEFRIQSGLADTAIRYVSTELAHEVTKRGYKLDFAANRYIRYSQQTASTLMKATHPAYRHRLPTRLSLCMAETRFQFPFTLTRDHADEYRDWYKPNDMVLCVGESRDKHIFMAFLEAPEQEQRG